MAPGAFLSRSHGLRSSLCRTCLRQALLSQRPTARFISTKNVERRKEADAAWAEQAAKIKNGEVQGLWEILKERGFVKDTCGTDQDISELMRQKRIGAYVGIDPTAASLHLGHMLPLMALFWFYIHGYHSISIIGGATAKVGDPTGRLTTRDAVSRADRAMYTTKIHYQLKQLWANVDSQAKRFGYQKEWAWKRALRNNMEFYHSTPFTTIVSRLFTGMRVGPMLSRETVKRKMTEGDGMSLAEFIYPMMQAWDWWHMFSTPLGVQMQIGGSDQYGNIVAGAEAVKMLRDTEPNQEIAMPKDLLHSPVGFTVPLLTDSSGAKFGKSSGNAVWLDPFMTSSVDVYGYFMRRPDADVEQLLKLFTFLPLKEIQEIVREHEVEPSKRVAQHKLAFEVVALIHGIQEAQTTEKHHRALFSKNSLESLVIKDDNATSNTEDEEYFYPARNVPKSVDKAMKFRTDVQLPESLILGNSSSIGRILYAAGLATSASDGHRLASHQGAYVGGMPGYATSLERKDTTMDGGQVTFTPVKNWHRQETPKFLIDGKILILRRGKHFVRVVEMVTDEEWAASGQSYPGESGTGRLRLLRHELREASSGDDLGFTADELARIEATRDEMKDEIADISQAQAGKAQIKFPPPKSRAAKILELADAMERPPGGFGSTDWKRKTAAIDMVLAKTRKRLEREMKLKYQEGSAQDTTSGESHKDNYSS
ncbi:tRNA synthetase class I [Xylariaceae sp. FL0016]|nr:tRNA synthetase class I [Xylariaceae sp. FL0016]